MDKRISGLMLFLLLILSANSQWLLQDHPGGFRPFFDIQFINRYTGWVTGDSSTILRTTDGGGSWAYQVTDLTYYKTLKSICMLDENTGYASGLSETLLKTTSGGNPWFKISELPNNTGNSFNDINFINSETGWIAANAGIIFKTSDGGITWDTLSVNSNNSLNVIQFVSAFTGWVAGETGFIRKTTNCGLNWFYLFFGTTADFGYNSLHFLNENTGWAASYRDIIFKSTDGGILWDSLAETSYSQVIRFADSSVGWCGGSESFTNRAVIYKSTGGGTKWIEQPLPFGSGYCTGIWTYSDSIAWAVYAFRIIHTTNGGDPIGITNINNHIPEEFNLEQNYPNPFNSSTTIGYEINESGHYKLEVFDVQGRQVEVLFNTVKEPGTYKLKYNTLNLSSGIYFYTLSSSLSRLTRKFALAK